MRVNTAYVRHMLDDSELQLFPSGPAGFFSAASLLLQLNVCETTITKDSTPEKLLSFSDCFSCYLHERTHWLDYSSTYWGIKTFLMHIDALNTYHSNDPSRYAVLKRYADRILRNKFNAYYRNEGSQFEHHMPGTPWALHSTAGYLFNGDGTLNEDEQIVLARFSLSPTAGKIDYDNSADYIIRVPISTSALLETNAMFSMHKYISSEISSKYKSHTQDYQDAVMQQIYAAENSEYSIAVHCYANTYKETDILSAYERSAYLSYLSLSIPYSMYDTITIPDKITSVIKRVSNNPGLLYYVLTQMPVKSHPDEGVPEWIDELCKQANLPDRSTILDKGIDELETLSESISSGPFDLLHDYLFPKMLDNMRLRHNNTNNLTDSKFHMIPVTTKTKTFFQDLFSESEEQRENYVNLVLSLSDFYMRCCNFNRICLSY